jgi:hypothetical protein
MFAAGEALEEPYANVVCASAILGRIRAHGLPEIVQIGIEPSVEFGSEEGLPAFRGRQSLKVWLSGFLQETAVVATVRRPGQILPGNEVRRAVRQLVRPLRHDFLSLRLG